MEPFDYYVSGVKINHQVPRFEARAIMDGNLIDFNLNDWFGKKPLTILVFFDQLLEDSSVIQASKDENFQLIYIALDDINVLKKSSIKEGVVISDKTHQISNLYGVLDEHTHALYNSLILIKNTGQLKAVLSGLNKDFFKGPWPEKILPFIK